MTPIQPTITVDRYPLSQLRRRLNSYNSAVAAERGFVSGNRVYNRKYEEKELREALWANREKLVALVPEEDTTVAKTEERHEAYLAANKRHPLPISGTR